MSSAMPAGVASATPCARCAALQRTCCQRADILVTLGDLERIRAHGGRTDFWEQRAPSDPVYLEEDPEDPRWKALTVRADGTRRTLRRRADGDCTFLGARGCELPREVRPLVCRLYPHGYNEAGLVGRGEDYCPTRILAPDGRAMSEVLEIDRADARRWHATLYRELHEDLRHAERHPELAQERARTP